MNYTQIIKRSWEILKANKFLWGLGILAGLVSGGGGWMPSFNVPSSYDSAQPSPAVIETLSNDGENDENFDLSMVGVGKVLGEAVNRGKCITRSTEDVALNDECGSEPIFTPISLLVIFICIILGIIIGIVAIYLGISANAGLILAVDKIETTGEKMGFKNAFGAGRKFFWRVFGVGMLYLVYLLACFAIMGALVGLAILLNNTASTIGIVILGVFVFVTFLVVSLYLGVLYLFVQQIIVLENLGPIVALKRSHLMVKNQWRDVIISWIVMIGIGFVIGLAVFLGALIIFAILALIGFGIYWLGGMTGVIVYGIIFGILFFAGLFVVRGFVVAYMSIFSTLVYRALRYLQTQKTV